MSAPPHVKLTAAQIAKQAERKAAKLAKRAAAAANGNAGMSEQELARRRILKREWVETGSSEKSRRAKVTTWNMLAQTLVRRDLFPGSDCLRFSDRKPMLQAEMEAMADADVICLQECDRLDDVLSSVPEHTPLQAKGRGKKHGLVILYRTSRFAVDEQRVLSLDDERLSESSNPVTARGVSRQTKNIALLAALRGKQNDDGIIVITTHLFWHPKFEYERARQLLVLLRAARALQSSRPSWPILLTGDLNTQPREMPYQLLASRGPYDQKIVQGFEDSRLVHTSVEKVGLPPPPTAAEGEESAPASTSGTGANTPAPSSTPAPAGKEAEEKDDEGEGEGELPDSNEKSIANTRPPTEDDGILSLAEIEKLAAEVLPKPARSAYASTKWGGETYAARGGLEGITHAEGGSEPAYTCFTPLFRLTLDYLFDIPSQAPELQFTRVLAPPKTEELGDGLPRKGVSASDHLPFGAEVAW